MNSKPGNSKNTGAASNIPMAIPGSKAPGTVGDEKTAQKTRQNPVVAVIKNNMDKSSLKKPVEMPES